jgi:hypothetical protein
METFLRYIFSHVAEKCSLLRICCFANNSNIMGTDNANDEQYALALALQLAEEEELQRETYGSNNDDDVQILDDDAYTLTHAPVSSTSGGETHKISSSSSSGAMYSHTIEDETVFPDLHSLFHAYDVEFFDGKLAGVEVRWSPRMTLCAGLCVYQVSASCTLLGGRMLTKVKAFLCL